MKSTYSIAVLLLFLNCQNDDLANTNLVQETSITPKITQILALGDSYTIGQSVCDTCRFPAQLASALKKKKPDNILNLKIIARTGWTTTDLSNEIEAVKPTPTYDLVTLLIGVNNQYQNIHFPVYEKEFPELVSTAITLAKGDYTKVIIVSIPDYAFTPFGQSSNPTKISAEIDRYNAFAEKYALQNNISFVNITDITRKGLEQTNLVANDGLHPSEIAYHQFVERILPLAIVKTR